MPYKNRTAFHELSREYLNSLRPRDVGSERGVVRQGTKDKYRGYLREAGEILDQQSPRTITLQQMQQLEGRVSGESDRTILQKLAIIRAFLRYCGNQDAFKWRIRIHPTPYRGGVFLRERKVAELHLEAAKLGPTEELVISLAVDMGLRCVDINNLTLDNAMEFLQERQSEILGKGRDGGKLALQTLSKYTEPLLLRYLEHRKKLVARTGDQTRALIVREVKWNKKHYLTSLDGSSWTRIVRKLSNAIGLDFTMHDLRRTLGNRLWRRGVPIETIAKILRHEDSGVTFRAYIGVDSDDMMNALDDLCGLPSHCPAQASQLTYM